MLQHNIKLFSTGNKVKKERILIPFANKNHVFIPLVDCYKTIKNKLLAPNKASLKVLNLYSRKTILNYLTQIIDYQLVTKQSHF